MPDRKSFMIDMENRIDRIQQTINELGFGTTEREFQVGLRAFYEYGLCATQCVKFASDKTFCEFVEALNSVMYSASSMMRRRGYVNRSSARWTITTAMCFLL